MGYAFRIVVYQERDGDNLWTAHCLETDLAAHGGSIEGAFARLGELTEMQISFNRSRPTEQLLYHPAPKEATSLFEEYDKENPDGI